MRKARNSEWSCAAVSLIQCAELQRDRARKAPPKDRVRLRGDMRCLALAAREWPIWKKPSPGAKPLALPSPGDIINDKRRALEIIGDNDQLLLPLKWGAHWLWPDGWYRLFPPGAR